MNSVKSIIEQLHKDLALVCGTPISYQDTDIIETEAARATDPLRRSFQDNWWNRATPATLRDVGREQSRTPVRRLERLSRTVAHDEAIAKRERMTQFLNRWRNSANFVHDAAPAVTLTAKYFGAPGDQANSALANLSKQVDVNSQDAAPWWGVLNSYVRKLAPGALVRDLDGNVVENCIREILKTKETR